MTKNAELQQAALGAALHQSTAAPQEATASKSEAVAAMQVAKDAAATVEALALRVDILEDCLKDARVQNAAVAQERDAAPRHSP